MAAGCLARRARAAGQVPEGLATKVLPRLTGLRGTKATDVSSSARPWSLVPAEVKPGAVRAELVRAAGMTRPLDPRSRRMLTSSTRPPGLWSRQVERDGLDPVARLRLLGDGARLALSVEPARAAARWPRHLERRLAAATAKADKLPQAILARAFSGELVPTEADLARAEGRTYEAASDLLRRVAATAPPQTTKPARGRRGADP